MRNESLILYSGFWMALDYTATTRSKDSSPLTKCAHQTTAKWLRLWKSAIPSLFEPPNLKLFQAAHSVQRDKWYKATLSQPRSARTKLDFPAMPVKLDGLNTPSVGWGIKSRAFRGLSFMSTKRTFKQPLGLQCSSTAAPIWPVL